MFHLFVSAWLKKVFFVFHSSGRASSIKYLFCKISDLSHYDYDISCNGFLQTKLNLALKYLIWPKFVSKSSLINQSEDTPEVDQVLI